MRKAAILVNGIRAGELIQFDKKHYQLIYNLGYEGAPISLTMPIQKDPYLFDEFPSFFDGLLPEGSQLDALLRKYKLDKDDFMGQLLQVGQDLVGAVAVEEIT